MHTKKCIRRLSAALCTVLISINGVSVLADSVIISSDTGSQSIAYNQAEVKSSVKSLFTGLEYIYGTQISTQPLTVTNNGTNSVEVRIRLSIDDWIVNIYTTNNMYQQLYSLWDEMNSSLVITVSDESGNVIYTDSDAEYHEYYKDIPLGTLSAGSTKNYTLNVSQPSSGLYSIDADSSDWSIVITPVITVTPSYSINGSGRNVSVEIPIEDDLITSPISKSTAVQTEDAASESSVTVTEAETEVTEDERSATTTTLPSATRSAVTSISSSATGSVDATTVSAESKINPETGDNTPLGLLAGMLAASGIGMCILGFRKKRA